MEWAFPHYDAQRVNVAGRALRDQGMLDESLDKELEVVNNWRSSHNFPLQIIKMTLLKRAKNIDGKAVISQRLKRLPSIRAKLCRESLMRLSQMQDIGGCRAVLADMKAVDKLVHVLETGRSKNPTGRHVYAKPKDYIACPKSDGYRSIHYRVTYRTKSKDRNMYNGLKIEIQIRSRLQHAWATAVETVDALTGRSLKFDLKSNIEDPRWKRFFALMGSAIALREKRPLVPGTPISRRTLRTELRDLAHDLHVEDVLGGFGTAVKVLQDKPVPNAAEYILVLNSDTRTVSISSFTERERPKVDVEYLKVEKQHQGQRNIQIVRVSVESIRALKRAYPNYYLDTGAFLGALRWAIGKAGAKGSAKRSDALNGRKTREARQEV